ncbi:hypothetical protein J6590_028436 [Homalodisca vitripennis]|nr:hypothetical protein J6590_028436 [Homalodisca vitripennis]
MGVATGRQPPGLPKHHHRWLTTALMMDLFLKTCGVDEVLKACPNFMLWRPPTSLMEISPVTWNVSE